MALISSHQTSLQIISDPYIIDLLPKFLIQDIKNNLNTTNKFNIELLLLSALCPEYVFSFYDEDDMSDDDEEAMNDDSSIPIIWTLSVILKNIYRVINYTFLFLRSKIKFSVLMKKENYKPFLKEAI
jgi:hypothetical protein